MSITVTKTTGTGWTTPTNTTAVKNPIPFQGYRNFYGSGKDKYYIYPDNNWEKEWGRKPLLGTVYADEPFYAIREAHSKGLAPINFTFGLIALKEKLDEKQFTSRRYN